MNKLDDKCFIIFCCNEIKLKKKTLDFTNKNLNWLVDSNFKRELCFYDAYSKKLKQYQYNLIFFEYFTKKIQRQITQNIFEAN